MRRNTATTLAATFLCWDNPADNDRFFQLSKKIAESLGSY